MTYSCTTKGYALSNVMFDEKRGTIFNSNKEIVMITPRVRDVYVLDMTSSTQESSFFAKDFENLNWLWHKRLAHLNFKTINKLAKQNLVISLPSLTSSIKKCIHLFHMDLFGPVTPRCINHEKYTLVIVDEYSRTENGTEFKNSTLVNFYDEKVISKNFSSFYTPEQNSVAERKNKTLIKAARTMLSGSVFSKQYWTEAVATACYTQNRSIIVKRHLKTPYEIFLNTINIAKSERYPLDEYLHPYEPSQRGEALQAKNAEALKSKRTRSSNANRSKTSTRWYLKGMLNIDSNPEPSVLTEETEAYLSEVTKQSYKSHSLICMSMCGFVAFTGALAQKVDPGFDSNKEEVVQKVDDVSLVDGVFNCAFGGDGEEDFVMVEGVVVSSSSLDRSTKSCLGGIMFILIFLEGLEEEACVDAMEVEEK
ncbi:retrovirus-related pol polyprotein from transposon TNT 1-94 [Tanacetum coccineum]